MSKKELKDPQLKTMLNKVGKTPNDEPEIYSIIKEGSSMAIYDIPKFVIDRAKKDIDSFDSNDLALFYRLVANKVVDVKYENGKFKSTENTKELENIPFIARVTLFNMSQGSSEIDDDDTDALDKVVKKQQDFIWKSVNISKKGLSDWEVNLVEAIVMAQATETAETALDFELGN